MAFNMQLITDVLFACTSSVVFAYITLYNDFTVMLDDQKKDILDFMVAFVMSLSWIRFFMLFLVMPYVSNMLQTLIKMLIDVCPFAFLMAIYMIFSAQIITTLYMDVNKNWNNLFLAVRSTFDIAMMNYDYTGFKSQEIYFSVLNIFSIYIIGILMLNFLIAILSTTYS